MSKLTKKSARAVMIDIYNLIKGEDAIWVNQMYIDQWKGDIQFSIMKMLDTLKMKDVKFGGVEPLVPSFPKDDSEEEKVSYDHAMKVYEESKKQYALSCKAFEVMKDLSVNDAIALVDALHNAVDFHKDKLISDKKVDDLGIKFVSDEKAETKTS